ncbi:hypothetical protein JGB26_40260 [Streptomyces flavofungini]|uniref:MFS transporter n=2 Tax=Streptomyces flavofungini TaxID=68200 RepID=A0ABS0XJ14_9ACTN|nr:hypothetical protein [Streptomyces flavofungini]
MAGVRRGGIVPLVVDGIVPVASYYLLSKGFGMSTMAALAWSSVFPALRTAWSIAKERRVNGLALLILSANVGGLLLSLIAGDPRLMLAKDSGITGVIGLAVLVSVVVGQPLMSAGLKVWVTKGNAARTAAWEKLAEGAGRSEEDLESDQGARFVRLERRFSVVWGSVLFGEAVLRIVGAYTVPIDTMVWLSSVLGASGIVLAIVISGGRAVGPMEEMVGRAIEAAEVRSRLGKVVR